MGTVVNDPDPSGLSTVVTSCNTHNMAGHHAGRERRCAVLSGMGCQKADDTSGSGNGTMTGETQSDSYSLEKGPEAGMFAKIVSASMHLHFVTTPCLGAMGYCDKHCLTPVVSNSSGYSCPVSSLDVLLRVFSCLDFWGTYPLVPSLLQHPSCPSSTWFKAGTLRFNNTTHACVNVHYCTVTSAKQGTTVCLVCLGTACSNCWARDPPQHALFTPGVCSLQQFNAVHANSRV